MLAAEGSLVTGEGSLSKIHSFGGIPYVDKRPRKIKPLPICLWMIAAVNPLRFCHQVLVI